MSLAAKFAATIARRRLSASLSGSTANGSGVGNGPFTTDAVTVTPSGGAGGYTYLWERVSGDSSISISSTTVANPTWSASGSAPATKSATWRCTVTDASGVQVVTSNVTVSLQFSVSALSASVDLTSATGSGNGAGPHATNYVSVTPSGGQAPYTYLWERQSGDATISPNDTGAASVQFSASGTPVENKSAVWRCKVTDNIGQIAYAQNVSVSIDFNYATLTASASPLNVFGARDHTFGAGTATTDDPSVCTAGGGSGSYSYLWERVSGDSSTSANSASSASTTFSRFFGSPGSANSNWRCKVTDNVTSNVAYTDEVGVALESFL